MTKAAITVFQNRVMLIIAVVDVACWTSLIFLAFKWATCTCGA